LPKIRPMLPHIQGLADCLTLIGSWGAVPPIEGAGKAKALALQALAIDSLAWATMWYDYDFAMAEKEFERSLELNPRYITGHEFFGFYLAFLGRYEEGYTELQRAIRLAPLSSPVHLGMGFVYASAYRFDQAIAELEKSIQLEPGNGLARAALGYTLMQKSLYTRVLSKNCKGRLIYLIVRRQSSLPWRRHMPRAEIITRHRTSWRNWSTSQNNVMSCPIL
jgi:tetratricopeptide (TPR) repeat protein